MIYYTDSKIEITGECVQIGEMVYPLEEIKQGMAAERDLLEDAGVRLVDRAMRVLEVAIIVSAVVNMVDTFLRFLPADVKTVSMGLLSIAGLVYMALYAIFRIRAKQEYTLRLVGTFGKVDTVLSENASYIRTLASWIEKARRDRKKAQRKLEAVRQVEGRARHRRRGPSRDR